MTNNFLRAINKKTPIQQTLETHNRVLRLENQGLLTLDKFGISTGTPYETRLNLTLEGKKYISRFEFIYAWIKKIVDLFK
ncbi:MAG: hypothetical protein JETCAE03_32460 [Ignavibacteriaceae bacterium]|nr:MAG: hypothetical protein JETCAE03_32460 [Ignavibacteriaceae bacterium]